MIIGIPNVGKSTLINQLIGRKSAKTGDIPAVTKTNQRLTLRDDFLIYDTPGMMWEKIMYPQVGYNLALCNSIGRNALDEEVLTLYLLEYLQKYYPESLTIRYKLSTSDIAKSDHELLDIIAKRRGCILSGHIIDKQKISELIIQDFRSGRIGLISLETPELWEEWLKTDEAKTSDDVVK
jgi:ribosome biogenesis GTPase A